MRLFFKLPTTVLSVCLVALLCKGVLSGEVPSTDITEGQILMISNLPYLPESADGYPFVVKDSMINLPLIAPLKASGYTHEQMKARIADAYKHSLQVHGQFEIRIRNYR